MLRLGRDLFELLLDFDTINGLEIPVSEEGSVMSDEMLPIQKLDILRAACCVAGIDGDANDAQTAVLKRLAREVGVGQASFNAMIERAETDSTFHEEQFKVLEFEPKATMATLLEVALADGQLSDNEMDVLRILAGRLGIDSDLFDQLLEAVRP